MHPLDSQFQQLGLNKFEVIDESSSQFKVLESLLVNTKGSTHTAWDLELLDAFEVNTFTLLSRFSQLSANDVSIFFAGRKRRRKY